MTNSLIITTINSVNKNIKLLSNGCKKNKWKLIIIGDKKTPKNFKIKYGKYISYEEQLKLPHNFSKICPPNNYARKNIGYLISCINKPNFILETDDDNTPKKNFFKKIKIEHSAHAIKNKSWINVYDLFIKDKKYKIWPRGLPLDELFKNKILVKKNTKIKKFYLQQGMAENNPDVDAIFRLIYDNINVKFKNYKIALANAKSTFNSQNTIWHNSLFELMYLPVTCSMRCTDIWRSLIALKILKVNNLDILFFGTTMYQDRNAHNILDDFKLEIPMYTDNKLIYNILDKIQYKVGKKYYAYNLRKSYEVLIKHNIFKKKEIIYLNAWLKDCEKLEIKNN